MNRKFQILLLVFLVLGLAVYFQEDARKKKTKEKPSELGLLFPDFDSDKVVSMTFSSFGGSIQLEKDNDKWFVKDKGNSFPADIKAVEKALDTTKELEGLQIISRSPKKHMLFQVNAAQEANVSGEDGAKKPISIGTMGTEVLFSDSDGKELAHFYIGKNGSVDFMSTYVRKAGKDEVLLVNGYLKMVYGKGNSAAWKDLIICELGPDEIASITLGTGEDSIVLEHISDSEDQSVESGKVWAMTKPDRGVLDTPMLQRITGMFKRFRGSDFADSKTAETEYGFDDPTGQMTLKPVDGEERTFLFGNATDEKGNNYFFKEKGKDQVYLVPKYRLDTIQKTPDEFFEAKK